MLEGKAGILYLVATPLGNLEDITHRALRILSEVDLIAAEDTRHTLKLLNHFQIKKSLISYYQHNERERADQIVEKILAGANVALVSDAGMPGISDPGNLLVAAAIERAISVVPIPGASAVITALAASGLDTASFWFVGFLPRKKKDQSMKLGEMVKFQGTLVFYEAPHRLLATLQNIYQVLGERRIVVARELTKIHEEFLRGSLSQTLEKLSARELKGEFTVLVEGMSQNVKNCQNSTNIDIQNLFQMKITNQSSLRDQLKEIAALTGKSTKELYQLYLETQKKRGGSSSS
ncbi:MAG TPA: 16S rRNA (cytidine(1402)-2'-O)-methyltransferase [Firmicutes bacterium]|jgi:16S rRNA (cytidine1402-2'-O)-methyltransferase|nr:16S rRNA (cytidine(1402)-2'-O)-methyltransferase [Bacillota bacterium]